MALILNIDTATEYASVGLALDGELIGMESNDSQKDHGSFIQPAIQRIFASSEFTLSSLDAIAVSNGPGSYTGLRVGLSTAKGLCYALNKPLILINTLMVMAKAIKIAFNNLDEIDLGKMPVLFCPLIDARRMEVFTAAYDQQFNETMAPCALIIDQESFSDILRTHHIFFSGSGAEKLKNIISPGNASFIDVQHNASHMATIAENMFLLKSFADKAYSEPFYLKEFFTPALKLKSD